MRGHLEFGESEVGAAVQLSAMPALKSKDQTKSLDRESRLKFEIPRTKGRSEMGGPAACRVKPFQKLLGHSDINTTMIYSHLAQDHLAEAVEKLELA